MSRTRAFYQSLGFRAGYHDDRYVILRRGNLVVHLEHRDELLPSANETSPDATATAEPELDPPEIYAGSNTLDGLPYGERVPTSPVAN